MKDGKHDSLAIVPRSVQEARDLAATYAKSALLPADLKGREADVFVTIMAGLELGLAPMASLRNIHIVKGRPILSADGMVGLVKASGLCESFACVEESDTSVTYSTTRKGEKPQTYTFTMEDARRAGLAGSDTYKKYPRAMLKARARAALARDVYPDVLAGVYEQSEAADIEDRAPAPADPETVIEAEFSDETPEVAALEKRINGVLSAQSLGELVDELKGLPEGPAKGRLRAAFKAAQKRVVGAYAADLKAGRASTAGLPASSGELTDDQQALPLDGGP